MASAGVFVPFAWNKPNSQRIPDSPKSEQLRAQRSHKMTLWLQRRPPRVPAASKTNRWWDRRKCTPNTETNFW